MRPALLLPLAAVAPVAFVLASCALPSEAPGGTAEDEAPGAPEAVADPPAAAAAAADEAETDAPSVPAGAFASLDALCAAQRELVRDRVAQAAKERAERYEPPPEPIAPSCSAARFEPKIQVKLRAPFLEVRSLVVETGWATETHVAFRTAEGWRAVPRASMTDAHEDPGCFSIERDTGIEAIRVEGDANPTLVIVEGTERGAHIEEDTAGDEGIGVMWSDVSRHVVACRLGPAVSCDEPVTVRVERVPSSTEGGRKAALRFATSYTVGTDGHVVPKARLEDARPDEP